MNGLHAKHQALCYFEYLRARLSGFISKIFFQWINFISTRRFIEPLTIPCCRNVDSCFYTDLNMFGIKRITFVAACTGDSKKTFIPYNRRLTTS